MKGERTYKVNGERLKVKGILVLFFLSIFNFQFSTCQVLYEISGNGAKQKSYILATNKFVPMQFLDTIPNVFKCFGRCSQVVTEFAMQDYQALAALRQAALLPDSVKLSNFYSESEYEHIDNNLRIRLGMGLDKLCRMKPAYLTEMIRMELMRQWMGYEEDKSMSGFFESIAAERGMPIVGLDDIGETMYMLFDREPFHWQCKELIKVIDYPENEVKQERILREMYRYGRLTDMAYRVEGPDNTTSISFSDYKVYTQRNVQWTKRLKPILTQGASFIVLDAVYLGGEKGLLQLLRAAGYRVRPVNRKLKIQQ